MNINMMHVGVQLGIQRLNSSVFGKLQSEEIDYYINTVTQEFIKLALTDEKNTVFDIATYTDIRSYYEKLQGYIRSIELGLVNAYGDGYVYGVLPSSITIAQLNDGLIYNGVTYKFLTLGTSPESVFADYGLNEVPVVGTTFECNIEDYADVASIDIIKGNKYKIINAHTASFISVGAANNNPGTEFTATNSSTITVGASTVLRVLARVPAWNGQILIPMNDIGYYMNIVSRSSVQYGNPITSGTLEIGKKYIVKTVGTTSFVPVGGVAVPDVNYIFTCTSTSAITWQGGTIIYQINDNGNRLVKMQDVDEFLQNKFGTVISSPISVFAGNKLRVYHGNKFNIERIHLDYIRKPIEVSKNDAIDSDLPESAQPFLVDLVVKKIAALSANPAYNAMVNEIKE